MQSNEHSKIFKAIDCVLRFDDKYPISKYQFMIMELASGEEMIMKEINELLPVSPGTMSNEIKSLYENGYVDKIMPREKNMRWGFVIRVTEKGKGIVEQIQQDFLRQP